MPIVFNQDFIDQQLRISPLDIDLLAEHLQNTKLPITIEEVAETIIRILVERSTNNVRVYSPEQIYNLGEKLIFLQEKGFRYAEIINIKPDHSSHLGPKKIVYDLIEVQFIDDGHISNYVSKCPDLQCRFKIDKIKVKDKNRIEFTTPGQIVTKFKKDILPQLLLLLREDKRFIEYDSKWNLIENLVSIYSDERDRLFNAIKSAKELLVKQLVKEIFRLSPHEKEYRNFEFSLNCYLNDDKRFIQLRKMSDDIIWGLAPPPNQISLKITSHDIKHGFIRITPGFKKILDFYNFCETITFVTYGNYFIKAEINEKRKKICGETIRNWYEENSLIPGDKIHIKSPEENGKALRIFTFNEQEKEFSIEGKKASKSIKKQIHLRDRIFEILKVQNKYLHKIEIQKHIHEIYDIKPNLSSIAATLSEENHLFIKSQGTKNVWGLEEWADKKRKIDKQSLLLAINEEDWVYRILEDHGEPLFVKEIAENLSKIFVVNKKEIFELTLFNVLDDRIIQFENGKLGLKKWKNLWREKLNEIDQLLKKIISMKDQLNDLLEKQNKHKKKLSNLIDFRKTQCSDLEAFDSKIKQNREKLNNSKSIIENKVKDQNKSKIQINEINELISQNRKTLTKTLLIISVGIPLFLITVLKEVFFLSLPSGAFLLYLLFEFTKEYQKLVKNKKSLNTESQNLKDLTRVIEETDKNFKSAEAYFLTLKEKQTKLSTEIPWLDQKISDNQKLGEKIDIEIVAVKKYLSQHDVKNLVIQKEKYKNLLSEIK